MLHVRNYIKQYGERIILKIDSLDIENKIYWAKGQNGAGKTTLFKSLSGIVPFSGAVSIDDVDLYKSPRHYRLLINYAEADPIYPGFLTGRELLDFYIESKSADHTEAKGLVTYFGIENFVDSPIGTYSSGMLKKLSILLAFIGQPRFILLDEPLVTVEHSFLPHIYQLIHRYHHERQVGFLISSHQPLDNKHFSGYQTLTVANQTVICER